MSAGADQTITVADPAFLRATVSDDGLPGGLADLRIRWSQVGGPGAGTFDDSRDLHGVARFSAPGSYTLRLSVSDGAAPAVQDDVAVTVLASAQTVLRVPQDYPTIQAAIDAAPARALVLVSPGTYVETVTIAKTITLASTYYTTGDQSLVDRTLIQAPSASAETVLITKPAGPETEVVGFKVAGGGRNGIKTSATSKVIGNHVTGIATDGVEYTTNATGLVDRNVIEDNLDDGIDLNFSDVVVSNNAIRGNHGDGVEARFRNRVSPVSATVFRGDDVVSNLHDGIQLIDDDTTAPAPTATRIEIDRSTVANNSQAGIGLLDGGVSNEDYRAASLLERIVVTNSTIVGNAYGLTGGDNTTVVNDIFASNTNTALKRVDGSSLAAHNIFWANGLANDGSNLDAGSTLNANPLLDATYHLQSGSPAIDAGVATFTLANGEQVVEIGPGQYNGAAPDLGRYEASGAGGNMPPTVSAGPDQTITLPAGANLDGTVTDDGKPSGTLTRTWTKVSGPGSVTFGNASAEDTSATFSAAGMYVLRLTASDGALSSSDDVTVNVSSGSGGNDVIFADGFESGNLASWSSAATGGGDLSVSAAAARSGAFGMQAAIVDNTAIYVVDDRPAAETRYRVRFSLNPNAIAMAAKDNFYVLQSRTSGTAAVVRLTLRWTGSQYQLRGAVRTDGGSYTSTAWLQIPGNAWSALEFEWRAASAAGANNGSLTMWIDGIQRASLSAVDNDTLRIESTRLGAVTGIDTGTRGTMFFDDFESHRPT